MAKGGISALVRSLPPPGKLGRGGPPPALGAGDEPDGDEGEDYSGDEDEAAETSAFQRLADALGLKDVDAKEGCEALKDFIATIKE